MKVKYFTLGFMLCMSLFLLPVNIYAQNENGVAAAPPIINAEFVGNLLRISVANGLHPVEAIFVNDVRFNHRVDSALLLDISQYVAEDKLITVYAVDFAGNQSEVLLLTPPARATIPEPLTFTPDGAGTIVDQMTESDGKEFYTISSKSGNMFYMIIDRQRGRDNVYFLTPVTEVELIALAEASGQLIKTPTPLPTPSPTPEPTKTPEPDVPTPRKSSRDGQMGSIVLILLVVGVVGGAGYYIKIVKPKQQAQMYESDEEEDDEDIYEENDGNDDIDEVSEE